MRAETNEIVWRNSYVRVQNKLVHALFYSQFLFLFSLGNVSSFPLTIPFIVSVVFFIFSFVGLIIGKIKMRAEALYISIMLVLILALSAFASGYRINVLSFMLYIYYFSLFLLLDPENKNTIDLCLRKFVIIATAISIYSMYQFIAYNFVTWLPLKEIIPENLWTPGYNTIQTLHGTLFGRQLIKPHGIYSEASGLSKYSSIVILLLLLKNNYFKKSTKIVLILINALSILLSLSGSGIIILLIGFIYFFVTTSRNKRRWITFVLFALVIGIFITKNTSFVSYFLGRLSEFGGKETSAYYRFILPFKIGIENMLTKPFGFGPGNDNIAYELYKANETSITNGFGKIFVECGFIGLLIFISYFSIFRKINKVESKNNKTLNLLLYICMALSITSTFMNISVWAFILLMLTGKENEKIIEGDCYEKLTTNND